MPSGVNTPIGGAAGETFAPPTQGPLAPPPKGTPTGLNSPAHTGLGVGPAAAFAPPKVPTVSAAPVGSPQETQDKQAYALLSPQQLQQYHQLSTKRDAAFAGVQKRQQQLQAFAKLTKLGAQGVKTQQALLNQKGYNLPVDGNLTRETTNAIQDFLHGENTKAVKGAASAYQAASPIAMRQSNNQALAPFSPAARRQVADSLNTQLETAIHSAPNPNQAQKDTISSLQRAIKLVMDPINGYDATQVDNLLHSLNHDTSIDPATIVAKHHSIWDRVENVLQLHSTVKGFEELGKWFGDAFGSGYDAAQQAMNDSTLHNHGGLRGATDFIGRWGLGATTFFSTDIIHLVPGLKDLQGKSPIADNPMSQAVAETMTAAQRKALTKEGDILSVGKLLTGEWTPEYERIHGAPPHVQIPTSIAGLSLPKQIAGVNTGTGATIFGKGAPDPSIAGHHLLSGVLDLSLYSTKDPTVLLTGPLSELTSLGANGAENAVKDAAKLVIDDQGTTLLEKIGEPAVRAGYRRMVVDGTSNGRALFTGIGDVFREGVAPQTVKGLREAIPGLDAETAQRAVDAFKAETAGSESARVAGQKVVQDAFIAGKYQPKVGWVRQFINFAGENAGLIDTGSGGLLNPVGPGHGLSFVTDTLHNRLATLREWAAPKGPTASLWEHDATQFVNGAIDTAATAESTTWRSIYADTVATTVEHNDVPTRLWNVIDTVHGIDNPALTAAMEGMIRPYMPSEQLLLNMPIASFNEAMAQIPDITAVVQRLEVATAIFKGEVGDAAKAQFQQDLARGYAIAPDFNRKLVATAAENVGLPGLGKGPKKVTLDAVQKNIDGLPKDLQESLNERLKNIKLGGKNTGLRALARDVRLVAETPALRDEMQRLLEQVKGRGDLFAETGSAESRNIVQRGIGKAVGAVTTVVPPQELRFEYPTANEAAHGVLRQQAGDRYMSAFHVGTNVRDQILNDLYNAKTEEQMFSAVRRMVRVSIESTGVANPGDIMDMLAERGDFKARTSAGVMRSVDENGNAVENLQTLAQRIEGTRVPSPTEVARATRKAILDGAQDSTIAERMAARLKATADAAGNVHLFWTRADGRVQDISGAAHSIHRVWKFLVVSNAGMPLVGAVAGFVGAKGNILDRLGGAGLGFALGSLGMTRFIFRVAGVEDRFRIGMESGFTADNMIPGYSRMRSMRYASIVGQDPLRRTMSDDIVRVGNYGVNHFENDLLIHTDPDWVVLKATDKNAPDAWYRIINHQIDTGDPVMATLLREDAGHLGVNTNVLEVPGTGPSLVKNEVPQAAGGAVTAVNDELAAAAQAAVDASGHGATVSGADNAALLEEYAAHDTKTYYRGEPANTASSARGAFFTENESYAAKAAGEGGIVHAVDLPVSSGGIPLVGSAVNTEDTGWLLAGKDAVWADAAQPVFSPHFAEGTPASRVVTVETQRQAADRIIAEFLNTEEGSLWAERWKGARLGASKPEVAIQRMRDFIAKYSDSELSAMRIAGGPEGTAMQIDRATLERKLGNGTGPSELHAQQVWKMPRGIREVFRTGTDIIGRTTLSTFPNVNRIAFETRIFNGEYDRLVNEGVAREEAQRIADGVARETVNGVMHRFDEPSRFAAKIDLFSPFFHAKEDIVRVYGTLALENPVRTFRVVEQVARLFNNEKDNGLFRKDQFTGQWELVIPGGARLAHSLFGVPFEVNFTVPLQDFLFVGTSAYATNDSGFAGGLTGTLASSLSPSPGGPFWSVFARELANHDPSLFLGNDALHKWLFGYGPNGNLLSSNTSRLWMAMAGSAPPWEFANQEKWQNQLTKWKAEVGAELLYQNRALGAKGKGPDWVPSNAEVDSATKKFFKAWSFFSATVPAPSYPVLANRESYYAAENAFTLGGLLPWDQAAFLQQYPQFEPYLAVGGVNKYTGPEDLATLKGLGKDKGYALGTYDPKTGNWSGMGNGENSSLETSLGFKTARSWGDYKDSFKLYQRTSEYYRLKANASSMKRPAERERALSALNHKYHDIVGTINKKGEIRTELTFIKYHYPKSEQQNAYNRIKAQYGISNSDFLSTLAGINDPYYAQNVFASSRYGDEIAAEVAKQFGQDTTSRAVQQYVGGMQPSEQSRYWQYMMDSVGYDPNLDNPKSVLDRYYFYEQQYYTTKDQYPQLTYVPQNQNFVSSTAPQYKINPNDDYNTQFGKTQGYANAVLSQLESQSPYTLGKKPSIEFVSDAYMQKLYGGKGDAKFGGSHDAYANGNPATGKIQINRDLMMQLAPKDRATYIANAVNKEYAQASASQFVEKNPDSMLAYLRVLGVKVDENPKSVHDAYYNGQVTIGGTTTTPQDMLGYIIANQFTKTGKSFTQTPTVLYNKLFEQGLVPAPPQDGAWTNPFTKYVKNLKADTKAQVSSAFASINQLTDELNAAYAAKNWKAYDALSAKRADYYNIVDAHRDQWLGQLPDMTKYYDDLHAMTVYEAVGNNGLATQAKAQAEHDRRQAIMERAAGTAYVYTSEQARFLYMPQSVQAAYVDKLTKSLDMPAGKLPHDVRGYVKDQTGLSKLFWSYLTPVQQSILEALHPNEIESWKYQDEFYLRGGGITHHAGYTNRKTGAVVGPYTTSSGATLDLSKLPHELAYAHAMLGKYDKRGGQPAPKAYDAYLKLPHSPAVKANFLIQHPDVAQWLQLGPLASMPSYQRDIVVNSMVKYGKSSAYSSGHSRGSKSWYGIHPAGAAKGYNGAPGPQGSGYADYKWAKYQLYAWNRRTPGMKAPSTYDLWLNMPSGQAKAVYLEQHPEIGAWLKLGPMANMPQEYQAVVRSILQQYGDWTAQQNPLSDVISKFYSIPGYAKQEFLAQHPELQAYWSATRSPAEQQMFDLQQTYFQIGDVGAKRAFLEEHPELSQHFLDARTHRYEQFLNQVAAYMGANPAIFTQYLNDQQGVLAELLRRYAQPNLIREGSPKSVDTLGGDGGAASDTGRERAPQPRRAARQGA